MARPKTATIEVFVKSVPFVNDTGAYTVDVPVSGTQSVEVIDFGETWEGESGVLVYAVVTNA